MCHIDEGTKQKQEQGKQKYEIQEASEQKHLYHSKGELSKII